jgi:DNA-binding transcriptional MerR regulator
MIKREKLYKIGEVMQYSGFSRQTLHNYTLAGLITEARRTESGHRLYEETVFDRLEKIKELQEKNYTLMQIKKIFEEARNSNQGQENV